MSPSTVVSWVGNRQAAPASMSRNEGPLYPRFHIVLFRVVFRHVFFPALREFVVVFFVLVCFITCSGMCYIDVYFVSHIVYYLVVIL